MVATESRSGVTVVTLKPHLSADWPQVKRFILLIAVVVFTVAAAWTASGIWLALLFALLAVGLIAYLLYRVCSRLSYLHQRIAVEPGRVVLREGVHGPDQEWVLARPAAHLHVILPVKEVDMIGLHLCDDDTRLELGVFLNGDGREEARRALRDAGLVETSDRWWETA
mgnify:FL=1